MTDQSHAITKTDNYKAIQQYAESPEVVKVFSSMMGSQGIQYIQSAIMAVRANDTLMMCEPKSIFLSALRAATLGLSCDPVLGHAFLIPYRNNQAGGYVATFQAGYKGIMNLATRTGKYRYINVSEVWNGEEVVEDRITGDLTITGEILSPKKPIGLIASFALFSGLKKSIYMTNEELEAHGAKYSKSYADSRGLWKNNKPAMYQKTVLLRLLRTWGYLSPEHAAILADNDGENMASLELPNESEVTVPKVVAGIRFVDPDPETGDGGMKLIERPQERILPTEDSPEYPEIVDDTVSKLDPDLGADFIEPEAKAGPFEATRSLDPKTLTLEQAKTIRSGTNGQSYGELSLGEIVDRFNFMKTALKDKSSLSGDDIHNYDVRSAAAALIIKDKNGK